MAQLSLQDVVVLIPARQPDHVLLRLVPELIRRGFLAVIAVDDGSGPEHQEIFEILAGYPDAHVVRHTIPRGKGRALKSGMSYFLNTFPAGEGVVMADIRHAPEDILLTTQAWLRSPQRMVVGVRRPSDAVPQQSRWENQISRHLFGLLAGEKLADTQGGLYAIPKVLILPLLTIPGEGGDYEWAMLAHACRSGQPPVKIPIRSVCRESRRSWRFHSVWDFLRRCLALFRLRRSR